MTVSECEAMVANMSDLADRIDEDNLDGREFADSVMGTAQSMLDWCQEHDKVTDAMEKSLEKMHRGLCNWVRN